MQRHPERMCVNSQPWVSAATPKEHASSDSDPEGSHLHRAFDPFRVNENVYPRSVGVASSPTATKLNPFGIPNACELQLDQTDPLPAAAFNGSQNHCLVIVGIAKRG